MATTATALDCASLCEQSYCDQMMDAQGFRKCPAPHVDVFARSEGSTLLLVFRGTDSAEDWRTDFQIQQIPLPWSGDRAVRVHYGFLKYYNAVRNWIHRAIEEAIPRRVLLASHSLGSGVATLCAHDLATKYASLPIRSVTFGSPRVGNYGFAAAFENATIKSFRFADPEDVIPTVPYANYMHVPGKIICTEEGWSHPQTVEGKISCCHLLCACPSVRDHTMRNYVESLTAGEECIV